MYSSICLCVYVWYVCEGNDKRIYFQQYDSSWDSEQFKSTSLCGCKIQTKLEGKDKEERKVNVVLSIKS